MENRGEARHVNERPEWKPDPKPPDDGSGSVLRGCGIAFGVALLILAFIVGKCFI